jgi:hypothetical protein
LGREPEEAAAAFKLANVTGLSIPLYTARQAKAFFDDLQAKAAKGRAMGNVTYEDLVRYGLAKYKVLPPTVQAMIIISKDFYQLDIPEIKVRPLSSYDWDGIDRHIEDQRLLIMPFLLVE